MRVYIRLATLCRVVFWFAMVTALIGLALGS